MRLTFHSDYALRVLIYLAVHPDRRATAEQIASAYGISRNHIAKVVQRLAHFGFVQTLRGRSGGMKLARPAEEISVGAVLRVTEENFDLVECFRPDNDCCITPVCRLKSALKAATGAYLQVLDEWTLDELVVKRRGLARRLVVSAQA